MEKVWYAPKLVYSGIMTPQPTPCELVGYIEYGEPQKNPESGDKTTMPPFVAVTSVAGQTIKIHSRYLDEMQPTKEEMRLLADPEPHQENLFSS